MPKLTKNLVPSPVKWRSKSLSPALSTGSPARCPAAKSKKESIRLEREESARGNAQNDGRVRVKWLLEEESVRPTKRHECNRRHRSPCSLPTSHCLSPSLYLLSIPTQLISPGSGFSLSFLWNSLCQLALQYTLTLLYFSHL
jgi:hypothetical protein